MEKIELTLDEQIEVTKKILRDNVMNSNLSVTIARYIVKELCDEIEELYNQYSAELKVSIVQKNKDIED